MPLLLRLGQYTLRGALEVLGRYIEPTGAMESSRRIFHRVVWNIPIQLRPSILMGDRAYRIDASSSTESISWRAGSILYIYMGDRGCGIQWKSTESFGRISIPIRPVLRVLSVLPATSVNAVVALDLHSRFGSICGPCRMIRMPPDPSWRPCRRGVL